jgi:hypothetical protein
MKLFSPLRKNPLQALDVPCQEFQLKGELKDGPYYLTAVFQFDPPPRPDLPVPLRTCQLKPGIPVLATVGDVICTALCSANTGKCDCCDGSVNTADPADPSNTAVCPVTTRTDCSYCEDAVSRVAGWNSRLETGALAVARALDSRLKQTSCGCWHSSSSGRHSSIFGGLSHRRPRCCCT